MPEREYYTDHPRPILWLVPGGELTVGGPEPLAAPVATVAVEPFYLSKLPVSNEQFEAFDPGYQRSPASPGDRDPAVGVSWHDAAEYCAWYAEVARKPIRLPTDVEWEYACRAGSAGRWPFGDAASPDDFLWHRGNTPGARVPPLDGKRANGFGLHGMLGGVWEWVGALQVGPSDLRVLRGGSFRLGLEELSCSLRREVPPGSAFDDAGFRIARPRRV